MQHISFFHRAHWRRKIYTCCPSEGWTSGRLGDVQKQGVILSNMLCLCSEWVSVTKIQKNKLYFQWVFYEGDCYLFGLDPFTGPLKKWIWQKYSRLKDITLKILFTNVIQMHRAPTTVNRLPDMTDVGRQRMKKWGAAYLPLIKVWAFL